MFESLRNTKYILNKRARVLMFGNMNTQTRYKSITTRPNVIIQNKYQRKELDIGLYGYSLLASNTANRYHYYISCIKFFMYYHNINLFHSAD